MIKTLKKHGNSHALVIDKPTMDMMGIDENTPLSVTLSGTTLTVAPTSVGLGSAAVDASLEKIRARYDDVLKRLAK